MSFEITGFLSLTACPTSLPPVAVTARGALSKKPRTSASHGDAARIAKQLIPGLRAHDGRVDSAQHRVDAAELGQLSFVLAPLGDVPGDSVYPDYIAYCVAGEASPSLDPAYLAARLHDPVFSFECLVDRRVFQ